MRALRWAVREPPLPAAAVVGRGPARHALIQRLLAYDDAHLARLQGVASPELVAVAADTADLPWVDGLVYVGQDQDAPSLWLPTTLRPDVPLDLLQRAILARAPASAAPVVVLVDGLIPMGGARPVTRERLQAHGR